VKEERVHLRFSEGKSVRKKLIAGKLRAYDSDKKGMGSKAGVRRGVAGIRENVFGDIFKGTSHIKVSLNFISTWSSSPKATWLGREKKNLLSDIGKGR